MHVYVVVLARCVCVCFGFCVSASLLDCLVVCLLVCLLVSVRGDVHAKLWISGLVHQTVRFMKSSTSLPGGNQVDGLPPASSAKHSLRSFRMVRSILLVRSTLFALLPLAS